jgi:hypothetical protein
VFLISNPIYDVYTHLSKMKKYSRFMEDVEKFISPYHYEEKPLEVFESTLTQIGFTISHMEIRDQIFIYDNLDLLKCKPVLRILHPLFFHQNINPFPLSLPLFKSNRLGKGCQPVHIEDARDSSERIPQ